MKRMIQLSALAPDRQARLRELTYPTSGPADFLVKLPSGAIEGWCYHKHLPNGEETARRIVMSVPDIHYKRKTSTERECELERELYIEMFKFVVLCLCVGLPAATLLAFFIAKLFSK